MPLPLLHLGADRVGRLDASLFDVLFRAAAERGQPDELVGRDLAAVEEGVAVDVQTREVGKSTMLVNSRYVDRSQGWTRVLYGASSLRLTARKCFRTSPTAVPRRPSRLLERRECLRQRPRQESKMPLAISSAEVTDVAVERRTRVDSG